MTTTLSERLHNIVGQCNYAKLWKLCSEAAAALDAMGAKVAQLSFNPDEDFVEGKAPWDLEPHYSWAVNELTERKAYHKSECATLIAEQRQAREAAEAEVARLRGAAREFNDTVMALVNEHLVVLEVAGTLAEKIVKAHQAWLDAGIESVGH